MKILKFQLLNKGISFTFKMCIINIQILFKEKNEKVKNRVIFVIVKK